MRIRDQSGAIGVHPCSTTRPVKGELPDPHRGYTAPCEGQGAGRRTYFVCINQALQSLVVLMIRCEEVMPGLNP